jgi:hypothetical protein
MNTESPVNLRLLVPVGSQVILNPSKLKECNAELGVLDSAGKDIVNFNYSHPIAYSDNEVVAMVISYDEDKNDSEVIYMALMPDEKEDTILFIKTNKDYKGFISFLTLLDSDSLKVP